MRLKDYILTSSKTRSVKKNLEKIDRQHLDNFLKKDFNKDTMNIGNIDSVFNFIGNSAKDCVKKFKEELNKEGNLEIFITALQTQAKSTGTKKDGLYYRYIYNPIKQLSDKKSIEEFFKGEENIKQLLKNIKIFLLAKKDKESKIDDNDLNDEEKNEHRKHFASTIEKLKSKRLSNVLKVFMVLVLWEYITADYLNKKNQIQEIPQKSTDKKTGQKTPREDKHDGRLKSKKRAEKHEDEQESNPKMENPEATAEAPLREGEHDGQLESEKQEKKHEDEQESSPKMEKPKTIAEALSIPESERQEIVIDLEKSPDVDEEGTDKALPKGKDIKNFHAAIYSDFYYESVLDNYNPLRKIPENDKYLQYALRSYAVQHGKKHGELHLYCRSFGKDFDEKKEGETFEIDDCIICSIKPEHISKAINPPKIKIYEICVPSNALAILGKKEENSFISIIPSKTTFKVQEKPTTKDQISNKVPLVQKLKITKQVIPPAPTEKEIEAMADEAYNETIESQNEAYKKLQEEPYLQVLWSKGDDDYKSSKQYRRVFDASQSYSPFGKYLHLLGNLQATTIPDELKESLSAYTSKYDYTDEEMNNIDKIFDYIEPLKKQLTVFRSMDQGEMEAIVKSYHTSEEFKDFEKYKVGNNRFLSTTTSPYVASFFLQATLGMDQNHQERGKKGNGFLKLELPVGTKALVAELDGNSGITNFQILLRRRETSIQVTSVTTIKNYQFIDATVVV